MSEEKEPSQLLAYSVASMLRFLTPMKLPDNPETFLFNGKFLSFNQNSKIISEYASGLTVDIDLGEYTFAESTEKMLPQKLFKCFENLKNSSFDDYKNDMKLILKKLFGLDEFENIKSLSLWNSWLEKIQQWYRKIVSDEFKGLTHISTLRELIFSECWIHENEIEKLVMQVVNDTPVIDLHTHMFPSSHNGLLSFGIDELLTYHYLVAEYFMICESKIIPEGKFA